MSPVFAVVIDGSGESDGYNLVNAIYSKGANTVLGFKVEVERYELNSWTKAFMISLSMGATVADAMQVADCVVQNDYANDTLTPLFN